MSESDVVISAQSLVQEADQVLRDDDVEGARALLVRAIELDPDHTGALLALVRVSDDLEEREGLLHRVQRIDPNNPYAIAGLAEIRRARRKQAEEAARSAAEAEAVHAPPVMLCCYVHPERETGLRCTSCDRPICAQCVTQTAVGQICPECTRVRTPPNYQVGLREVLIGGGVALGVSLGIGFLVYLALGLAGFFTFLLLFLFGPALAEGIVRSVEWATRNKRGRRMQIAVGVGIVLGVLPYVVLNVFMLIFMVLAIVTAVARLR